jgi:hypothetical protein
LTVLDAFRDLEFKVVDAVESIGVRIRAKNCVSVRTERALESAIEIELGVGRAATLDTVENFPCGGLFDFLGISFVGNADLARTTTVNSSVGTTNVDVASLAARHTSVENKLLIGSYGHLLTTRARQSYTVAREVGTIGLKRILDGSTSDRLW